MSLTSFLKNEDVKEKFSKEFPKPKLTLRKELQAPPITRQFAQVGTAFDYLMRFYLKRLNPEAITRRWVAEIPLNNPFLSPLFEDVTLDVETGEVYATETPISRKARQIIEHAKKVYEDYLVTGVMTDELINTTLLLAQMDFIFRKGMIPGDLGIVSDDDIADLKNLIALANPEVFRAKKLCVLNPLFGEASHLVGGADADIILDNILIDIKTVKSLRLDKEYFHQLIGYYILFRIGGISDAPPSTKIDTLGIYYSRYGELYTVPVSEIMDERKLPSFIKWFEKRATSEFAVNRHIGHNRPVDTSEQRLNSSNTGEMQPSGILSYENSDPFKLKRKLLKKYKGANQDDVFNGDILNNKRGSCYLLTSEVQIDLHITDPDTARNRILADLKTIPGIGEYFELSLKQAGYDSIEALCGHAYYGHEARTFLKLVDQCETLKVAERIGQRFSLSHPLNLLNSSFHEIADYCFLDLETLGLFGVPIILIGLARYNGKSLIINQFLLRDVGEEAAALSEAISMISKNAVLITFNGKTFDLPFIKDRLRRHRISADLDKLHLDMLFFARRVWKHQLPNCKLQTLEEHLFSTQREDDVPSDLVPDFYETYRRTGNIGPLIPIVEHNKQDLVTLAQIFSRLHEEWG